MLIVQLKYFGSQHGFYVFHSDRSDLGEVQYVGFLKMLAGRIASLTALATELAWSERLLAHGSREEISAILRSVKGVGDTVVDTFVRLRGARG